MAEFWPARKGEARLADLRTSGLPIRFLTYMARSLHSRIVVKLLKG